MEFKKVVAIVRNRVLERVEERLIDLRVRGISVSRVKGYGDAVKFFNPEWEFPFARIEVFCEEGMVEEIVEAILDTAHTGFPGDGIVAVHPVETLYDIRSKSEIMVDQL